MGVAQPRQGRGLLAEPAPRLAVGQRARGQDLQRDVAAQLLVPGEEDFAHAPAAQSLLDAVVGERAADHARASRQG